MKVKVAQSCPTLCDSMNCILQARILEWVAFPFSNRIFPTQCQNWQILTGRKQISSGQRWGWGGWRKE